MTVRRGQAGRPTIADLDAKPGHLIRRAHQRTAAIFDAATSRHRVTPTQHVVMTALYTHPGVDQATLASLVALDKVTVGLLVTRLEGRGLIQREPSNVDRRARVLTLTPTGRRRLAAMQSGVRRSQEELLAPLSPAQKKQFFIILRRLVGMTPPYKKRRHP
ncbi:MAG: MarR family winged helix-turn-helix transcriptional regulator [Burkholderiales bacterium]